MSDENEKDWSESVPLETAVDQDAKFVSCWSKILAPKFTVFIVKIRH